MIADFNEEVAILGFPNVWVFLIAVVFAMLIEAGVIGGIIFWIYDFIRKIAGKKYADNN